MERRNQKYINAGQKYLIPGIVSIVIILLIIFNSITIISAGTRGIVLTFGAVSGTTFNEGLNFKVPFAQSVVPFDVRTQAYERNIAAVSLDLQDVDTKITLNYHVDPNFVNKIYQEIGAQYVIRVIQPAVDEVPKQIAANYKAEELITKRPIIKAEISQALEDRLTAFGIIVEQLSITNFQFSQVFSDSIEAKVVALQSALEAENKLREIEVEARQVETRAIGEANAAIAKAEGDARAIEIISLAQKEANERLAQTVNATLNQYYLIQGLSDNVTAIVIPTGADFILDSSVLK